jgi:toxin CcdB
MARFDVYRLAEGGYALDCQSDIMADYNTRFVVPLRTPKNAPPRAARLNPMFNVEEIDVVMVTQFASTLYLKELGEKVTTLADHHTEIIGAIEMLVSGY